MKKRKLIPAPSERTDVSLLLHGAVIYGRTTDYRFVIGRARPFIPLGVEPDDANRECDRRYAVYYDEPSNEYDVREVNPADVVPFADVEALRAAANARANAVQETNKREPTQ